VVGQVRDAGCVDDPGQFKADGAGFQPVEQADPAAEHDGDKFDGELAEQAGLQALADGPAMKPSSDAATAAVTCPVIMFLRFPGFPGRARTYPH
jgi:hypothetical protein